MTGFSKVNLVSLLHYFQKFYVKNSPTGEVGIFVCIVRSESSDCFFGIGLGRLE
ncbi:uncharacterized protein METZ01_LOCUS275032 [marine metagenome]|uniref:Uncharacterized protein n=1 Tax=marine metagenome TaxID=408172 RepID=A0A382KCU1_9ZZZZ